MNIKKMATGALCAALGLGLLSGCGLGRVGSVNNGEVNMHTGQTEVHGGGDIAALPTGDESRPGPPGGGLRRDRG